MNEGSSSIFGIWWRTRKELKQKNSLNTIWPSIVGILILVIDLWLKITSKSMIQSVTSTLLALNGGLLGFTIAGFGIFQSIPKSILTHAVSTQAEGYPWSFYKLMLLNYLHVLFVTFLSVCALIVFYLISFIPFRNYVFNSDEICGCINFTFHSNLVGKSFLFSGIVLVQMMVMIKLKTFLFWIYDNSLMVAKAATQVEHEKNPEICGEPFDQTND